MSRRFLLLASFVAASGCGESRQPPPGPIAPGAAVASGASAAHGEPALATAQDAGATSAEPPPYQGPYFGATSLQALVVSDMEWPTKENKVQKLGYIRIGEKAPVIPEPHEKSNCKDGWYELVAGGYVCGKYGTLDLNHPKFRQAHPPDLEAALPYTYGQNWINGTPLYRVVPSREERKKYEPWLTKRHAPPPSTSSASAADPPAVAISAPMGDAGALPPLPTENTGPSMATTAAAPAEDDSTPWYLKEYDGGAPPQVTLDELREEGDGPVVVRMVKGFYLSLDRQFVSNNNQAFWRLNNGLIAPAGSVTLAKPQIEWHGVWLDGSVKNDAAPSGADAGPAVARTIDHLPVGFVTSKTAHKWLMADSHKSASMGGALKHWAVVELTEQTVTLGGTEYFETTEGWWMRGNDGTKTEPGPPPDGLAAGEKWIDVNLKRQTLVAFVGDKAVFATIVSSGRPQHDTPPGTFRIREKHISATMDGDAEQATDGPYSIQDVPYIQYFNAGYALHGAFWHSNFGHVQSHGCVNLSPLDAKGLFGWTEPQLPDGWHAVMSTHQKPGTRVVLHF